MATLSGRVDRVNSDRNFETLGPLADDRALYQTTGLVELKMILNAIGITYLKRLAKVPEALKGYKKFQYGTRSHSSQSRKILRSITPKAYSDIDSSLPITHIVVIGSSLQIVGRNVTKHVNKEHIDSSDLGFKIENETDSMTLIEEQFTIDPT